MPVLDVVARNGDIQYLVFLLSAGLRYSEFFFPTLIG